MTPVWIGMHVLEVRHQAIFFWGWCDGVMDSARYFDLLGELVPQIRVSARTLALPGCFNFKFMLTPFFLHQKMYIYLNRKKYLYFFHLNILLLLLLLLLLFLLLLLNLFKEDIPIAQLIRGSSSIMAKGNKKKPDIQ